jgi:hypothetical protein
MGWLHRVYGEHKRHENMIKMVGLTKSRRAMMQIKRRLEEWALEGLEGIRALDKVKRVKITKAFFRRKQARTRA